MVGGSAGKFSRKRAAEKMSEAGRPPPYKVKMARAKCPLRGW